MVRSSLFAIMALLAAGCARYDLVDADRVSIAGAYTVDPQIRWSRRRTGNLETWTVDGPLLQEVIFVTGLEEGDKLFPRGTFLDRRRDRHTPSFRGGMTAIEILEMFEASLSQGVAVNIETRNLRPARFGSWPGFRFEFDFVRDDGLERQGFAVGAVRDGRLHMIVYSGVRLHFYPTHKDDVERLIRSIRAEGPPP